MPDIASATNVDNSTARKPCICIFSALYEPHVGGVESYTKGIAEALVTAGCRVIVATSNTDNTTALEAVNGIDILRLPCNPLLNSRFPIPKSNQESKRLWSWLNEQPIDYIVVNTRFYPHSILGLRFAKRHGIQPVLIEHGSAHLTLGNTLLDLPLHGVEHAMTAIVKRYSPCCYAVSGKASEWLSHFGFSSCGEVPNSIEADAYLGQASNRHFRSEFNIPDSATLIASAGRFVPEKGVLQLAKATQLASDNGNSIFIIMAGNGPLLHDVEQLQYQTVITPGMLSKSDLSALLQQADCFCLPSRSEGFSTVLLEAAACSTAVIATDVGGMREIAPTNEYGIILESMEPKDIAAALTRAAANPEQIRRMGTNAAKRVRQLYTWDKSAQLLLHACKEAQLKR